MKWLKSFLDRFDRDKLLRHGFIVLFFTHLGSLANVLFQVVMGRTLSSEEYGIMASMLGIGLVIATPMAALQNTLAHITGHLVQEQRLGDVRLVVGRWLKRILIIDIVLFVLMVLSRHFLTDFFHLSSPWPVIIILMTLFLTAFSPVIYGALQGVQAFVWMSAAGQSWGFIRLILGSALVLWVAPVALFGIVAHSVGALITTILGFVGITFIIPRRDPSGLPVRTSDRYFLLSLFALFGFSILMNADLLLVKHYFAKPEEYGIYARASTIARTMFFLSSPLAGAMFPKVVSMGTWSREQGQTLIKGLVLGGFMIAVILVLWLVFPGIPLLILFKDSSPSSDMIQLVRFVSCAMAPLGLTYLILNFELAQNRFAVIFPILACALAYAGGVALFHRTLTQVVSILCVVSVASLIWLIVLLLGSKGRSREAVQGKEAL